MELYKILQDFIPIGVLLTFISSVLSIFITRKNMKTTKYIETITTERIKWLQLIRDDISDIFTSIDYICTNTTIFLEILKKREMLMGMNTLHETDRNFVENEIVNLQSRAERLQEEIYNKDNKEILIRKLYLISLRLNYKEDKEIIKDLYRAKDILINNRYNQDMIDELKQISQRIIIQIRTVLKNEWEKVKKESQKGGNSDSIFKKLHKLFSHKNDKG